MAQQLQKTWDWSKDSASKKKATHPELQWTGSSVHIIMLEWPSESSDFGKYA